MSFADDLLAAAGNARDPVARRVAALCETPAGVSSAGFPFLAQSAWETLRDEIAHLFGQGQRVLTACDALEKALPASDGGFDAVDNARRVLQVVRQVTLTAAITAPPDLWLLRNVLANLAALGLTRRLLAGDALTPGRTAAAGALLDARELEVDLTLLHARGLVESYDGAFRAAGHPRARQALEQCGPLAERRPFSCTAAWRRAFAGEPLEDGEGAMLAGLGARPPRRTDERQNHWIATPEELEIGWLLLPVVLALRACEHSADLNDGIALEAAALAPANPELGASALAILDAAGWVRAAGAGRARVTALGARGFARGPGPFGIVETYHPYLTHGIEILRGERARAWVQRGANVAASQDANHASFVRAHDALDAFCRDTGFDYRVFVEHACGRGEATRLRWERSGDAPIAWFGADLEDDAIEGALEEQRAGRLPPSMRFVRRADIGRPELLIAALRAAGVAPEGAVMMVGNGFHEVREQTDERMTEVFAGYERAGLVLLFTEENALSAEDLRATAWNTYHAGFRWVHEKSGQGLRPGSVRAPRHGGHTLRAAWDECAKRAGYVRADKWCSRARTIYPTSLPDGHNPAVSVNHFFVPARLAAVLGLTR
jgi:hypothetical protein